ncbi:hypothetical protein GA0061084_3287 [Arthrobacter sp. NIO-1057]|nr:hypothetical protein GA0061084_3287 [Arthrobacter sp. NIO-1057]
MEERSVAVDKLKQNAQLTGGAASGPTGKKLFQDNPGRQGHSYFETGSERVCHQ